jgi:hypothetical protein
LGEVHALHFLVFVHNRPDCVVYRYCHVHSVAPLAFGSYPCVTSSRPYVVRNPYLASVHGLVAGTGAQNYRLEGSSEECSYGVDGL